MILGFRVVSELDPLLMFQFHMWGCSKVSQWKSPEGDSLVGHGSVGISGVCPRLLSVLVWYCTRTWADKFRRLSTMRPRNRSALLGCMRLPSNWTQGWSDILRCSREKWIRIVFEDSKTCPVFWAHSETAAATLASRMAFSSKEVPVIHIEMSSAKPAGHPWACLAVSYKRAKDIFCSNAPNFRRNVKTWSIQSSRHTASHEATPMPWMSY